MSRIRVVAARLYTAFTHARLSVMSCRNKLTRFLLFIPTMLLPRAVFANGDLTDMVYNVEQGAKTAQSPSLVIAQFIGVIPSLGGLVDLKKVGEQGGVELASRIVSIVAGVMLVVGLEMMGRSQKRLGIFSIPIG